MGSVYTASTVIEASPERVFDYISVPENQPEWAINFVRSTHPLEDGRYVLETPFGEMTYRVDADAGRGVIDFVFETRRVRASCRRGSSLTLAAPSSPSR